MGENMQQLINTSTKDTSILEAAATILAPLSLYSVVLFGIDAFENYKLVREMNSKTKHIVAPPLDFSALDGIKRLRKKGIKKEYSVAINNFVRELKPVNHIDLSTFGKNLGTLTIEKAKKSKFNSEGLTAYFQAELNGKNSITILSGNYVDSIYHELLHLATSIIKGNHHFVGFSQSDLRDKTCKITGDGINEGYTEILNARYFSKYGAKADCYLLLVQICECLEMIFGQENMEKWYFECNLFELRRNMLDYDTVENVSKIINSTDALVKRPIIGGTIVSHNLTNKIYKSVLYTLLKWRIIKFKSECQDSENIEEYKKEFEKFLNIMLTQQIGQHYKFGFNNHEKENICMLVNMLFKSMELEERKAVL